jgi:hypothetical protein
MIQEARQLLPEYPKTPHLPFRPNVQAGDVVATEKDVFGFLDSPALLVEEKVDGANCGAILVDNEFIVRNREHILQKGYIKKNTPAKIQFRSLWNWLYGHKDCFEKLNKVYGAPVAVYGEWLWALHGIVYDSLPSHFIALEILPSNGKVDPIEGRLAMMEAGFVCPPLIGVGPTTYDKLADFVSHTSAWGPEQMEGVYLKSPVGRYKMLRPGYVQGSKWNTEKLVRQKLSS